MNLAARVASKAVGGQILVTAATMSDVVLNPEEAEAVSIGMHFLKVYLAVGCICGRRFGMVRVGFLLKESMPWGESE